MWVKNVCGGYLDAYPNIFKKIKKLKNITFFFEARASTKLNKL